MEEKEVSEVFTYFLIGVSPLFTHLSIKIIYKDSGRMQSYEFFQIFCLWTFGSSLVAAWFISRLSVIDEVPLINTKPLWIAFIVINGMIVWYQRPARPRCLKCKAALKTESNNSFFKVSYCPTCEILDKSGSEWKLSTKLRCPVCDSILNTYTTVPHCPVCKVGVPQTEDRSICLTNSIKRKNIS